MAKPFPKCSNTGRISPVCIALAVDATGWGYNAPEGYDKFLATAVAVALAESGGNASAVNNRNSNGSSDHGLFQINSVHRTRFADMWGDRYTVTANTLMAKAIWGDKQSFSPWSTYNSGAYKKFLPEGVAAYNALRENGWTDNAGARSLTPADLLGKDAGDAYAAGVDKVGSALGSALGFVKDGAIVVGGFALGLLLLALGVWFLVSQTKAGKTITDAATSAVPAGRIAKMVKAK